MTNLCLWVRYAKDRSKFFAVVTHVHAEDHGFESVFEGTHRTSVVYLFAVCSTFDRCCWTHTAVSG